MATQALSVQAQIPRWSLPHRPPSRARNVIEVAIFSGFSRMLCRPEPRPTPAPPPTPALSESESVSNDGTDSEILSVAYFPSQRDPVYIPMRCDILRRSCLLKLEGEDAHTHRVCASDVDTNIFRGVLRSYVADRPFFDPSGPPVWTAEYHPIYKVCNRIYVQKFTEHGHSMLYRTMVRDKGETAELRMLTESIIGRPTVYVCRTVRIFEEMMPYVETDFSPLPPPRPIAARPTRLPHQPACSCMFH